MQAIDELKAGENEFLSVMLDEVFVTCPICGGYENGEQTHEMTKTGTTYICDNAECEFLAEFGYRLKTERPVPSQRQIKLAADMRRKLRDFAIIHNVPIYDYRNAIGTCRGGFTGDRLSAKFWKSQELINRRASTDDADSAADRPD